MLCMMLCFILGLHARNVISSLALFFPPFFSCFYDLSITYPIEAFHMHFYWVMQYISDFLRRLITWLTKATHFHSTMGHFLNICFSKIYAFCLKCKVYHIFSMPLRNLWLHLLHKYYLWCLLKNSNIDFFQKIAIGVGTTEMGFCSQG